MHHRKKSSRDPQNRNIKPELEEFVDRYGIARVTLALSAIALEKADHIATNWQDYRLAKEWERAALILDRAYAGLRKVGHR